MIGIIDEKDQKREELYEYGRAHKESKESPCLNLMRMYNSRSLGGAFSEDEIKAIHREIFHEEPKTYRQEVMEEEEDKLSQFHLFNDKGMVKGVYDFRIFEVLSERMNLFILGGVPYHYQHGVYVPDVSGSILKTEIRKCIYPELIRSTTIDRVFRLFLSEASLQVKTEELNQFPVHWVNFRNGFYDPIFQKMIKHDPKFKAVNQIPHEFHPEMELSGDEVERWLRFITPDPDDREMLLQFMGLCLTRDTRPQKFMILNGAGGSGKSTLIRMLENMIGTDNLSHVSLKELSQRFASVGLLGKLLNSCADLEVSALEDTSVIKKILGEDSLRGEFKGKDSISFKNYSKLIFSTNELPLILSERTNGFYRRLMILNMDKQPEHKRPDYLDVLQRETGYLIQLAVRALERMYQSGGVLFESQGSKEAVMALRCDSDTVEAFLQSQTKKVNGEKVDRFQLFRAYEQFCQVSDRQSLTRNNFYRSMRTKGFREKRSADGRYFMDIMISVSYSGRSVKKSDVRMTQEGFLPIVGDEQTSLPFAE